MTQQKITQVLKKLTTEVFVDTIEAKCHCCAVVSKEHGWKHEGDGDFWRKDTQLHNGTVLLTFKPDKGQKGLEVKEGTIKVRLSIPKVFYGDNITGVYCSDRFYICSSINKLLRDELIFTTGVGLEIGFANFQVTRVDRSISSDAVTPERLKEMLRVFSLLYFPYHKPGKRCSKNYDYETSFCHTSNSEDIVAYDKSAEAKKGIKKDKTDPTEDVSESFEDSNDSSEDDTNLLYIKDNIFRVEISSKKALKFYGDFGTVKDVLTGNKALIRLLSYRKLHLDFAPEDEYWELITKRHKMRRDSYKADTRKKHPNYATRKPKTILNFLKYINEHGAAAAHDRDDELYNDCVELTSELGISVIYTTLNERLNFLDKIYRRADTNKIFLRDNQNKAIDEYEDTNKYNTDSSDSFISSVHSRIYNSKNNFICSNRNKNNKAVHNYKSVNRILPFHNKLACYKRE